MKTKYIAAILVTGIFAGATAAEAAAQKAKLTIVPVNQPVAKPAPAKPAPVVALKPATVGAGLLVSQPKPGAVLLPANGGNLVASGAGNLKPGAGLVASGAGNLVASGGGNLVASGGGNLVASGAGNLKPAAGLVASGAGNLVGRRNQ